MSDRINTIIHNQLCPTVGTGPDSLKPEHSLVDDLGADSLDLVELTMELEQEFDILITDDEYQQWVTVGDVRAFIDGRLG